MGNDTTQCGDRYIYDETWHLQYILLRTTAAEKKIIVFNTRSFDEYEKNAHKFIVNPRK